jgi:hypothetical protein
MSDYKPWKLDDGWLPVEEKRAVTTAKELVNLARYIQHLANVLPGRPPNEVAAELKTLVKVFTPKNIAKATGVPEWKVDEIFEEVKCLS